MSYIAFNHEELVNLNYSLKRELIRTNRFGGYASSTILNCHTRKYHGLLVVPQPQIDHEKHVLLSSLDEVILSGEGVFNLGIHRYPEKFFPKGHKYLSEYEVNPIPRWIYRVGDITFSKSIIFESSNHRVLVRYEVLEASEQFTLRLNPFLAFRNYHSLSKANVSINTKYREVTNGVTFKPYDAYDELFVQCNREVAYQHAPDWYYNIEYQEEQKRGYPYQEDLWVPGFFDVQLKKGDHIIISAGLSITDPPSLEALFQSQVDQRTNRKDFYSNLENAAEQLIEQYNGHARVCAGLPWFGSWGRDTFIALPGLTLPFGKTEVFEKVADTYLEDLKNGLFPNIGYGANAAYNSVDAPMWFIWSVQQLSKVNGYKKNAWKKYADAIQEILYAYKDGVNEHIWMGNDGLIFARKPGLALTWMDAVTPEGPVTPRDGKPVEINALWYNAIVFALSQARKTKDKQFVDDFKHLPEIIKQSFVQQFWIEREGYLADVVYEHARDEAMRPNQVIACSMEYRMLSDEKIALALENVRSQLLTPRGLRTLSPRHPSYVGVYQGDQTTRDRAYHQGTVWTWLVGHFAEGWLNVYGQQGVRFIQEWINNFEPHLFEAGIGSVSEIFNGDPPHEARGAISQAWSISELIRVINMCKTQEAQS